MIYDPRQAKRAGRQDHRTTGPKLGAHADDSILAFSSAWANGKKSAELVAHKVTKWLCFSRHDLRRAAHCCTLHSCNLHPAPCKIRPRCNGLTEKTGMCLPLCQ